MRVFLTGASGFIGSAIVPELIGAGHQVVGLARSDASAAVIEAAGAEVHRGSLDDLDSLRSGAAESDGVIHTAFNHNFSEYENAGRDDQRSVEALGTSLEGSGRPLVIASVTTLLAPGRIGTEEDLRDPGSHSAGRIGSEETAMSLASRDIRSSVLRLPASVHGEGDYAFVPALIGVARSKGVSAYIGDGSNRWPAVHRLDAARLFRLALESAPAGTVLHGNAEEGIPVRDIAEAISRNLEVPVVSVSPEEASDHFGWLGAFLALDAPTSSALTRERMAWHPTHLELIDDLEQGHYFQPPRA
jgi:nucleoside-diphosphate-sugar epimerase